MSADVTSIPVVSPSKGSVKAQVERLMERKGLAWVRIELCPGVFAWVPDDPTGKNPEDVRYPGQEYVPTRPATKTCFDPAGPWSQTTTFPDGSQTHYQGKTLESWQLFKAVYPPGVEEQAEGLQAAIDAADLQAKRQTLAPVQVVVTSRVDHIEF